MYNFEEIEKKQKLDQFSLAIYAVGLSLTIAGLSIFISALTSLSPIMESQIRINFFI